MVDSKQLHTTYMYMYQQANTCACTLHARSALLLHAVTPADVNRLDIPPTIGAGTIQMKHWLCCLQVVDDCLGCGVRDHHLVEVCRQETDGGRSAKP